MWRRSPAVAGSFYPSNPDKLSNDINTYLKNAELISLKGDLVGLIVPHAGYMYSGPVAAYAYKQLVGSDIEVAIVLAPSHRARFEGASIAPSGIYETPLGDAEIDDVLGKELESKSHIKFVQEVHVGEHSLEVQVPFLQTTLKKFTLVPVIIGTTDINICKMIAEEISQTLVKEKRKYMIVISTDLSHFHTYERASKIDNVFIENLKKYDADILYKALCSDEAQACGEGPVLTGIFLGKIMGASRMEILKYANSGDTAGGHDQVVGYLSAAMVK